MGDKPLSATGVYQAGCEPMTLNARPDFSITVACSFSRPLGRGSFGLQVSVMHIRTYKVSAERMPVERMEDIHDVLKGADILQCTWTSSSPGLRVLDCKSLTHKHSQFM